MKFHKQSLLLSALLLLALSGCFTGIESTPRIKDKDLRNLPEKGQAEASYTDSINPEPFALWLPGKQFKVTDSRIGIVFTSASSSSDSLQGREIIYKSVAQVTSLTGDSLFEIKFTDPEGTAEYFMRVNSLQNVEVPYAVEMKLVNDADRLLRGRELYIISPIWYDHSGSHTVAGGRRHIPVRVDSVVAGNSVFPALVIFSPTDESSQYSVYMSVGSRNNSTRNFSTLFSFTDPRVRYPNITEAVWQKIIHSQVQKDMTRDECRLALGAPNVVRQIPSTAGMLEQWVYDDGKYLIFEDGFLTKFRQ